MYLFRILSQGSCVQMWRCKLQIEGRAQIAKVPKVIILSSSEDILLAALTASVAMAILPDFSKSKADDLFRELVSYGSH